MPFVRAAGDLGDPRDEGGRRHGAGGAGEPDDPARDLVEVGDGDAVLQPSVPQRVDAFLGMVGAFPDQRRERRLEVDDDLVQGPAAVHAPGLLEERVEVEGRRIEGAVQEFRLGDPVESERARLGAQVAVPHEVPGVLAMEHRVRIETAPGLPPAPQGAVEQRHRLPFANGLFQQRQQPLRDGAGALGTRQRERLGRFLQLARRGVESSFQPRGQVRRVPERRVLQQQLQHRAFGGGQGQPAQRRALDQPVAVLVPRDGDALQAPEVLQVTVGGSLRDAETPGDLDRPPGAASAEKLQDLDQANRTVHGVLTSFPFAGVPGGGRRRLKP